MERKEKGFLYQMAIEVIVIFIGITLALLIDNYKDHQQSISEVKNHFNLILTEFSKDSLELQEIYNYQYIYDELPSGVIEKIKDKTPKTKGGHYKYRFHQSLTPEIGREQLKKQIIEVTTLMSVSKSKEQFQSLFMDKYGKNIQLTMEFEEQQEEQKLSEFNKNLKKAIDNKPVDDKTKK